MQGVAVQAHDHCFRWREWCVANPTGEQMAQPTG